MILAAFLPGQDVVYMGRGESLCLAQALDPTVVAQVLIPSQYLKA